MIIQLDLGEQLDKAQRLLCAIADISGNADDLIAPAIHEKSRRAAALITEVRSLLKAGSENGGKSLPDE